MNTPIILICGGAGSGKDTLAGMLAKALNGACIAQADPMKRFAAAVFKFDENQLWGPSEARNAVDPRYVRPADADWKDPVLLELSRNNVKANWSNAAMRLRQVAASWVKDVLPNLNGHEQNKAEAALVQWFIDVAKAHGYLITADKTDKDFRWGWEDKVVHRISGAEYVGSEEERELTPRYVLQTLGTEWGRKVSPAMWSEYAIRTARTLLAGGCSYDKAKGLTVIDENRATPNKILAEQTQGVDYAIITDGRFRNEIVNVKAVGGIAIEVVAPYKSDTIGSAGVAGHRSEAELKSVPNHFFDYIITNDKSHGLDALNTIALNIKYRVTDTMRLATKGSFMVTSRGLE